jgi:hypothetical protein
MYQIVVIAFLRQVPLFSAYDSRGNWTVGITSFILGRVDICLSPIREVPHHRVACYSHSEMYLRRVDYLLLVVFCGLILVHTTVVSREQVSSKAARGRLYRNSVSVNELPPQEYRHESLDDGTNTMEVLTYNLLPAYLKCK